MAFKLKNFKTRKKKDEEKDSIVRRLRGERFHGETTFAAVLLHVS